MSRYLSLLEWMRHRIMNEKKDVGEFWRAWGICSEKHFLNTPGSADWKQYKAEAEFFKANWPQTYFPGKNPRRKYTSQLYQMQVRGLADGMSFESFDATWNAITRRRKSNGDYAHYMAEKQLWDSLWGWTRQPFPGVDPGAPHDLQAVSGPRPQNPNNPHSKPVPNIALPAHPDPSMTHNVKPFQRSASEPPKNEYLNSSPEEIVEKYTGEGIEFGIGGKTTRRTLDYGKPEWLEELVEKKELKFEDIPPKSVGRGKKRKLDERLTI